MIVAVLAFSALLLQEETDVGRLFTRTSEQVSEVARLVAARRFDEAWAAIGEAEKGIGLLEKKDVGRFMALRLEQWRTSLAGRKEALRRAGAPPATAAKAGPPPLPRVELRAPRLAVGLRPLAFRLEDPRPRQATGALLGPRPAFDETGLSAFHVPPGRYRFDVLHAPPGGSTLIALSSGSVDVAADLVVTLEAAPPCRPSLRDRGGEFTLDKVLLRAGGTLESVAWTRAAGAPAPQLILSPGRSVPARLLGRRDPDVAAAWGDLTPDAPSLELGGAASCGFEWHRTQKGIDRIREAVGVFHLPEGDDLELPLSPRARLVTNRRFVEFSYRYAVGADRFVFHREPIVLGTRTVVPLGGTLEPTAYARLLRKDAGQAGDRKTRALVWGAELATPAGHLLNVLPRSHPASGFARPEPSSTPWKATLRRRDGQALPAVPEHFRAVGDVQAFQRLQNLTEAEAVALGDPERLPELLEAEVEYAVGGESIRRTVPVREFVTWSTARVRLEAPAGWRGRAACYLDKMERLWEICDAFPPAYRPDSVWIVWTNNYMSGYTMFTRDSKMQMGFYDLRERFDLYSEIPILAHELLHSFDYRHGPEHDRAIERAEAIFGRHRAHLADHPEYLPAPVTSKPEIRAADDRF